MAHSEQAKTNGLETQAADTANVGLAGTPSYSFATASVGDGKSITASGHSLSGSAAGNYNLSQPTGLTAASVSSQSVVGSAFVPSLASAQSPSLLGLVSPVPSR